MHADDYLRTYFARLDVQQYCTPTLTILTIWLLLCALMVLFVASQPGSPFSPQGGPPPNDKPEQPPATKPESGLRAASNLRLDPIPAPTDGFESRVEVLEDESGWEDARLINLEEMLGVESE